MKSFQTTPSLTTLFPQGDIAMRLKLAAVGALAPSDFDRLFAEYEVQSATDLDRTLESVVLESGLVSQEQWDAAARLAFSPPESIFAEKHNVDLGIRGMLFHLGFVTRKAFDMAYGEWTSHLGDEPNKLLRTVAVIYEHVTDLHWLEAQAALGTFRARQAELAYAAGAAGLDADLIIACVEAAVPFEDVVAMLKQGNASKQAAQRRMLEDYLALYADDMRSRRPVVRRIIAKYGPAFPAFDAMVKAEIAVGNLACALVAGADNAIAISAAEVVQTGLGSVAFNYNLGILLLDYLPEIGCEGGQATK